MNESNLRDCVRAMFTRDVEWIEPSYGSSVGVPDCKLCGVPVELKFWKVTRRGVRAEMRPAQIRWHVMNARQGQRSAIMYGLQVDEDIMSLHLLPGFACPKDQYQWRGDLARGIGLSSERSSVLAARVRTLLSKDVFFANSP